MTYPGQSRYLIVHQCGHMKLEHLNVLQYDVGGSTILLISDELLIALHNVPQFVSQVILLKFQLRT